MNNSHIPFKGWIAVAGITASGFIFSLASRGQTVSFDVATGSGSFNTSPFFDTSTNTDHPFIDGEQPLFNKAAGTVTVDAPVLLGGGTTSPTLEVNTTSGTTQTFGAAGTTNAISFNVPLNGATLVQIDDSNTSDVVFNAPLTEVQTTSTTYNTLFDNYSNHNVTYGNINVTGVIDNATNFMDFKQAGTGTTTIAGTVSNLTGNNPNVTPNPIVRFGDNYPSSATASYVLSSTAVIGNGVGVSVSLGTLYLQTSNLGDQAIALGTASVLTDAAGVNNSRTIYTGHNDFIGGAGAFDTTFSGSIQNYNPGTTLVAGAGGKVHFTGEITQNNSITVAGPGVVSLEYGNTYNGGTTVSSGAKLLLNNAPGSGSGSATGNIIDPNNAQTANNVVTLNGGGLLGGTGSTIQGVVANTASSVISPGDMTGSGVSSIGTLTLGGGLTAANGLTINFDLNGTSANDEINVGNGPLTLDGTITLNFTNLGGALSTTTPYVLIYSAPYAATFNDTDPTTNFVINGPAGYTAELSGNVNGSMEQELDVTFSAVPEPSTYGLMGLGALGLLAMSRLRKVSA